MGHFARKYTKQKKVVPYTAYVSTVCVTIIVMLTESYLIWIVDL